MPGDNIFLIFDQPKIPLETYEEFVNDFGMLIHGTTTRMQNAWVAFQESVGQPKEIRVESLFTTSLIDWQELASRAQEEIGNGHPMHYQDVYEQFHLGEIEDTTTQQLKEIEHEMFELIDLMREILLHAATRIEDDPANAENVA